MMMENSDNDDGGDDSVSDNEDGAAAAAAATTTATAITPTKTTQAVPRCESKPDQHDSHITQTRHGCLTSKIHFLIEL
jgi:hypothetical protein